MSEQEQLRSVIRFYETHPINEYEILEKLRADGIDLETLTEEVLKDYDQDHFGGLEAVDVLAEKAGIDAVDPRARRVQRHGRAGALSGASARLPGDRAGHHREPARGGGAPDRAGRARPPGRLPARQRPGHAVCGCHVRCGDRAGSVRPRAGQAAPDRGVRTRGQAGRHHRVHRHSAARWPERGRIRTPARAT